MSIKINAKPIINNDIINFSLVQCLNLKLISQRLGKGEKTSKKKERLAPGLISVLPTTWLGLGI